MKICLICKAKINRVHMGIDCCRACSVFYRRAVQTSSERKFRCKLKANNCVELGRVLDCRSCRFNLMREIFEQANKAIPSHLLDYHDSYSHFPAIKVENESEPSPPPSPDSQPTQQDSDSSFLDVGVSNREEIQLLNRIRCGYDAMIRVRRTAEICLRPLAEFVHPRSIDDNSFIPIPAKHGNTVAMKQIELSALYDFASIAFPEFSNLLSEEKWRLVSDSCERVGLMDSTYRSAKAFPHDDRVFATYTTIFGKDHIETFFDDCPLIVDSATATNALRTNMCMSSERSKQTMKRIDPSDEEFHALLALSFWNSGDASLGEERICQMTASYRTAIMKDLHCYYTSKCITDYSARIGELFCLLVDIENIASMVTEDIELLKLMEIHSPPACV